MFETLSFILKFVFTVVIYIFILAIIRLIYFDINSIRRRVDASSGKHPYLKLLNRRDELDFKVDESYILDGNKVIGRGAKNDFSIQDPYLSGSHAEFVQKDGHFYIKDLGSKNGTFVNGTRISEDMVKLSNGDKIRMGLLSFIYVEDEPQR